MKYLLLFFFFISFIKAQEKQIFTIQVNKANNTVSYATKPEYISIIYMEGFGGKEVICNTETIGIPFRLFLELPEEFFTQKSKLVLQAETQTIAIELQKMMIFQYTDKRFRLHNGASFSEIKTIQIIHEPFKNKIAINNEDGYSGKLLLNKKEIELNKEFFLELWRGEYPLSLESPEYIVTPGSIKVEKEGAEHTITIMKPKKEYTIKIEKPDGFAETIFLEKQNKKIPLKNQQKIFLEKGEYTVNIETKSYYIENPIIHINHSEKQIIEIKINKRLVEGEGIPPYWQEDKYCYWNYPYWQ